MDRIPLFAGNWKMYKTATEARDLARAVCAGVAGVTGAEVVLCPPFTALAAVAEEIAASDVKLGAQNLFYEPEGAFTGEVSGPMLAALGCSYVICGHSERRQFFGDADDVVGKKVRAALTAGLSPILCVGETLAQREAGDSWKQLVQAQVTAGLAAVTVAEMARVVVAYEPVWAIGTGKTATPTQAAEAHAAVRATVEKSYGPDVAAATRILYGGSVKPDNVKDLMAQPEIDGALVGGASLKADSFVALVRYRG